MEKSVIISGNDITISSGFTAKNFNEDVFRGLIDPVIMLDHFRMSEPTFAAHPHAGISAVTYVFEDSVGPHFNYDSLGNHGPINPGALHWFAAGRGAVHKEQPEGWGQSTHALQIFVNLHSSRKLDAPFVVHVEAEDIPEYLDDGMRVRVVAGFSNGVLAAHTDLLPTPFTLLDVFLEVGAKFEHQVASGWNVMIYVISGAVQIVGERPNIPSGSAIALSNTGSHDELLNLTCRSSTHFVILSGQALNEHIVKKGPFVMNTVEQIQECIDAYYCGNMGEIQTSSK